MTSASLAMTSACLAFFLVAACGGATDDGGAAAGGRGAGEGGTEDGASARSDGGGASGQADASEADTQGCFSCRELVAGRIAPAITCEGNDRTVFENLQRCSCERCYGECGIETCAVPIGWGDSCTACHELNCAEERALCCSGGC